MRIRVLLDSGSNIFLLHEKLVNQLEIPYEVRQKTIDIVAFDGNTTSSGGKRYTHPITLEIGNGHRSQISAEIANAGHYDLVIPFGWWKKEHPISNIEDSRKWEFNSEACHGHVEYEAVADFFEYDETVAFDPQV